MPNTFAYIALIIWPFISLLFYRRLPIVNATFWTIVGGFLILPVGATIDLPFIPPLNKESIPVISAFIFCKYIKKIKMNFLPEKGREKWLVIILLVIPFFSWINNQESINFVAGLTFLNSVSSAIRQYLLLLPLILGMQLIKTHEEQILLFKLLVIAGLVYSLPILVEVRMSPQLHTWVYGFFPHSFLQQVRYGGFRPVVFIGHGLVVAMFVAITLGAAAMLWKEKIKSFGLSPVFVIIYFCVLLLLCKTVSGFTLGAILLLMIAWVPIKIAKRVSLLIGFVVLFYPLLLIFDLFPHQLLVQLASDFDPVRGGSLDFRFRHEYLLLDHAREKLFFGWGGWGRNRLEGSVSDGSWVIFLGTFGLLGFMSLFGLFVSSIWAASKVSVSLDNKSEQRLLIGHAVIVSIIMVDQLPNASLSAWMIFLVGALIGRVKNISLENKNYKSGFSTQ